MPSKSVQMPVAAAAERDFSEIHEHAGEAAQLMKALSNENRLMILCTLTGGEMTVGQLNAKIPISQSGLSQQLGILRREGLVNTRRDAQSIAGAGPGHRDDQPPARHLLQHGRLTGAGGPSGPIRLRPPQAKIGAEAPPTAAGPEGPPTRIGGRGW